MNLLCHLEREHSGPVVLNLPHVVVTYFPQTMKLFLLVLCNCNFAIICEYLFSDGLQVTPVKDCLTLKGVLTHKLRTTVLAR